MPTDPVTPHTIVLAIDGLRAAALGCYGAASYETPAFDAIAAEAQTYDWCYADTPDATTLAERLAVSVGPLDNDASLFITDDRTAMGSPLAARFAEAVLTEVDEPTTPAQTIAETAAATTLAAFAEALADRVDQDAGGRLFAWLQTQGLYGPWDAPPGLYEALVDEDDPEIVPSPVVPDAFFADNASPEACEARFAASCRYAAQVVALDACLDGWLDVVDGLLEGQAWRLVVTGLRGFPLGEHGRVGGVDGRLFSEQQQTALIVRHADPTRRFDRQSRPVTLSAALASVLRGVDFPEGPVVLAGQGGVSAVRDRHWLLRRSGPDETAGTAQDGPLELYVKPDDRWEQNDIASLEPDVVERLAERFG